MIEWKTIQGFSNYEISNEGNVRNKKTKKILKNRLTKTGYYQVSIKNDETNKFINQYIHRLVAIHFLNSDNQNNEVNHIDGNKQNNNINNLEWITHKENCQHRYNVLHKQPPNTKRKVGMFNIDGELISSFNSIVEAYKSLNKVSRVNIDNALQGKQKTAYGYVWKYLD